MEGFVQRQHLEYPALTMFQMVECIARQYPKEPAYEFYGRKTSYDSFIKRIERAARAFIAMGIKNGDVVTVCMPNVPQTLDCFYALDRIGAVANMIHPLSATTLKNEGYTFVPISELIYKDGYHMNHEGRQVKN